LLKALACEVSNELKDEVVARHPAIYDQLVELVVGFCGGPIENRYPNNEWKRYSCVQLITRQTGMTF
jgi:hypothetical protein